MVEERIDLDGVVVPLHYSAGRVRIADRNGNHAPKPTKATFSENNLVEWMVTNEDIKKLAANFLNKEERIVLIRKISEIKDFIKGSKYATRDAIKTPTEDLGDVAGLRAHKYTETFYSFEKDLASGIKIRVIFKRGDWTLTPFLFALLPFTNQYVQIANSGGPISKEGELGSGCFCKWIPTKNDVEEIVLALSNASPDHRDALKDIIQDINSN